MPLIATTVEQSGIARIFFDMRMVAPAPDEERRIATAIERAFALATTGAETERTCDKEQEELPRR
jgi:hypothetical protein